MQDCIFCKIIKHEIPAAIVREDGDVIAFMDIMPARKGHVLVVPKTHYNTILDIPGGKLAKVMDAVQRCARAVKSGCKAEGFNILQYNGSVSGQVVNHLHFHIIPRVPDDGLRIDWDHEIYAQGEMHALARKIIAEMDKA